MAKGKYFAMEFDDWEESYNELSRWLQVVQDSLPRTIVKYISSPITINGVQEIYCFLLERVL